jgi:hypothetical protein
MLRRTTALQPLPYATWVATVYGLRIAYALTPAAARVFDHPGIIVGLLLRFEGVVGPHRAQVGKPRTVGFATVDVYRCTVVGVTHHIDNTLMVLPGLVNPAFNNLNSL